MDSFYFCREVKSEKYNPFTLFREVKVKLKRTRSENEKKFSRILEKRESRWSLSRRSVVFFHLKESIPNLQPHLMLRPFQYRTQHLRSVEDIQSQQNIRTQKSLQSNTHLGHIWTGIHQAINLTVPFGWQS